MRPFTPRADRTDPETWLTEFHAIPIHIDGRTRSLQLKFLCHPNGLDVIVHDVIAIRGLPGVCRLRVRSYIGRQVALTQCERELRAFVRAAQDTPAHCVGA